MLKNIDNIKESIKDSYDKVGFESFKNCPELYEHVLEEDVLEVAFFVRNEFFYLEYVDNYRIFPISMKEEYDKIRKRGCCGFFDANYITSNNNQYLIGCNYGH